MSVPPEALEVEAEEIGEEIVPVERQSATLFRTDDPVLVVKRAQETAEALKPIVQAPNMIQRIGQNDHPRIELLQTLGSMLGVTAVGDWTKETDNGWEARAEVKTLDGRVIGAAESMCERSEENWKVADAHAIRSMAQTRAASKALASVMRFVLVLGGMSGTPAEEMSGVSRKGFASPKQEKFFRNLLKKAGGSQKTIDTICAYASSELEGGREGQISAAIDALQDESKARDVGKQLAEEAVHWSARQSDLPPPDTEGLPE